MTYIEPDSPGGQPEIMPPATPGPDIDPGGAPEEAPQQDPGGGGEGDSRPYGRSDRSGPPSSACDSFAIL